MVENIDEKSLVSDSKPFRLPLIEILTVSPMKKNILFSLVLLALLVIPLAGSGQPVASKKHSLKQTYRRFMHQHTRWELGLSMGVANSMTDIAAAEAQTQASITDVYSRGLSPALGVYSRYRFNRLFAMKANINGVLLKGDDRWSPNIDVVNRGKSFSNSILETNLLTEFYVSRSNLNPKRDFGTSLLDFFVFTGVSAFYHSPEVLGPIIDDFDADLLQRENAYNNIQMAIPLGIGLQWTIGQRWVLGLDVNFRYTFFDYLDGFRRPYSNRNDYFFTSNFNLGYIPKSKFLGRGKATATSRNVFTPYERRL